jgi:hypothetical protein
MNSIDKPHAPQTAETQDRTPEANIANALDDVCQLLGKADTFAHATEHLFNEPSPTEDSEARRRREHLAHLVGATAEAVAAALEAADQLAVALATRRMGA